MKLLALAAAASLGIGSQALRIQKAQHQRWICVCNVRNQEGNEDWWIMNGWQQGVCDEHNQGDQKDMGGWSLLGTCDWKDD